MDITESYTFGLISIQEAHTDNATSTNATTSAPSVGFLVPKYGKNLPLVRYICDVYLTFPIAILGIIGNVLAFIVLCRHKHKLTTSILLQALAITDTLVLIVSILLRPLRLVGGAGYTKVYHHIFLTLYPTVFFLRLVDTWLTVLLTIDRFIAVCYPLQAQRLCTLRRTYVSMTVVVVSAFIFTIPRFFELKYHESHPMHYTTTEMGRKGTYFVYKIVLFFLVMYLIPMVLLVVLNTRLVCTLRRANTYRESIMSHTDASKRNALQLGHRVSRTVTIIVVTVVLVCIVCTIMAMTSHILYSVRQTFSLDYLDNARRYAAIVSNVMITINCAVNFAIYCVCSRNFRTGFARTFSCNDEPVGSLGDKSNVQPEANGKPSCRESVSSYSSSLPLRVSFKKPNNTTIQRYEHDGMDNDILRLYSAILH